MIRTHLARWCVGAILLTLPAPATGAQALFPPVGAAPVVRVVITTANVRASLSPAQARADMRRATAHSTIVAGQEYWPRAAGRFAPRGWRVFHPARPLAACRDLATFYRADTWQRLRGHAIVMDRLGFPTPSRCTSVLVLRHRATGLVLPVVNVHMLPHVDLAGHPRPLPLRVAAYARGMARVTWLATEVRDRYGVALVAGDWNVSYPADRRVQWSGFPYAHLAAHWDTHWAQLPMTGPTHAGGRRIDSVWWSESRRVTPVHSRTIRGTWSDHNFVRLVIRVRGRG